MHICMYVSLSLSIYIYIYIDIHTHMCICIEVRSALRADTGLRARKRTSITTPDLSIVILRLDHRQTDQWRCRLKPHRRFVA